MSKEKDSKIKALQLTLDKLDKTYGKGTVMKMGDSEVEKVEAISTDQRKALPPYLQIFLLYRHSRKHAPASICAEHFGQSCLINRWVIFPHSKTLSQLRRSGRPSHSGKISAV